jgi:outer membrane biosynthesis protein TonB
MRTKKYAKRFAIGATLFLIVAALIPTPKDSPKSAAATTTTTVTKAAPEPKPIHKAKAHKAKAYKAESKPEAKVEAPEQTAPAPEPAPTPESSMTSSQENAIESAQSYLDMGGFSKSSLIEQLSSSAGEGFTPAQARYAADTAY